MTEDEEFAPPLNRAVSALTHQEEATRVRLRLIGYLQLPVAERRPFLVILGEDIERLVVWELAHPEEVDG